MIHFSLILLTFKLAESCISFYCINSCGASNDGINRGYKLILANNRDESIYRPTIPASFWPTKFSNAKSNDFIYLPCNQNSKTDELCVFGALDIAKGSPPDYYSTWLAINERGSIGNLLFYMQPSSHIIERQNRGIIIGSYLRNSSWESVDNFMDYLTYVKSDFKPFNYVQLEMSKINGKYSIYYVNNNNSKTYKKLNSNERDMFIFGLSNSDSDEPFNKVLKGKEEFKNIIENYGKYLNKQKMVDEIIKLLMNKNQNYPDTTLKSYLNQADDQDLKGISQISADYGNYWKNAHSRTSTLILIDHDDNVEYFEYNMTKFDQESSKWEMNSFSFKLKPIYKNKSSSNRFSIFILLVSFFKILIL